MSWTDNGSGTESYWNSTINEGLVAGELDVDSPEATVNFAEVKITEGLEAGDLISLESAVSGTVEYKTVQDSSSDISGWGASVAPSGVYTPQNGWFWLAIDTAGIGDTISTWTLPVDAFPTGGTTVISVTWTFVVERLRYSSTPSFNWYAESAGDNFPASVYFSSQDSGAITSQGYAAPRTQRAVASAEDLLDGTYRYTFTGAGMVAALQAYVDDPANHSGFTTGWTTTFSSSNSWSNASLRTAYNSGLAGELTIEMIGGNGVISQGLSIASSTVASTYRTWLNNVKYSNTIGNPQTWPKNFSIEVGDFNTGLTTTLARTMDRQPPVVSDMESTPLTYGTAGETIFLTNKLNIVDVDSNLVEAEVTVHNFNGTEDVLELKNTDILAVSSNSEGVFVLSNEDTPSNYQFALRRLTYSNRGSALTTREMVVSLRVKDEFGAWSNRMARFLRLQGPEAAAAAAAASAAAATAAAEASVAESGLSTLQIGILVAVFLVAVVISAVVVWRFKRKV